VEIVGGLLSLRLSGSSGSLCLFPDLTPIGRTFLDMYLPACLLFGLAVHLPFKKNTFNCGIVNGGFLLFEVAYSTMLSSALSLLSCSDLQTHGAVLTIAAHVTCYEAWQIAVFILLVLLSAYPVWLTWVVGRLNLTIPLHMAVWQATCIPYSDRHRRFCASQLLKRLVLIAVFASDASVPIKILSLGLLNATFLVVELLVLPYRHRLVSQLMAVLQLCITVVAVATIPWTQTVASQDQINALVRAGEGLVLFGWLGPLWGVVVVLLLTAARRRLGTTQLKRAAEAERAAGFNHTLNGGGEVSNGQVVVPVEPRWDSGLQDDEIGVQDNLDKGILVFC